MREREGGACVCVCRLHWYVVVNSFCAVWCILIYQMKRDLFFAHDF